MVPVVAHLHLLREHQIPALWKINRDLLQRLSASGYLLHPPSHAQTSLSLRYRSRPGAIDSQPFPTLPGRASSPTLPAKSKGSQTPLRRPRRNLRCKALTSQAHQGNHTQRRLPLSSSFFPPNAGRGTALPDSQREPRFSSDFPG